MKRSLLTEGHGIPIGLVVDGANRHDMKLVRATLESLVVNPPEPSKNVPQGMCLDKGYDYADVRAILASPLTFNRAPTKRVSWQQRQASALVAGSSNAVIVG